MALKTVEISLPGSPCKLIKEQEKYCFRVKISYGGGMGGASKEYYASEVKDVEGNMLRLTLLEGHSIDINKRFVVEQETGKRAEITYDVTEHTHFNSKKNKKLLFVRNFFLHSTEKHKSVLSYNGNFKQLEGRMCYTEDIATN